MQSKGKLEIRQFRLFGCEKRRIRAVLPYERHPSLANTELAENYVEQILVRDLADDLADSTDFNTAIGSG